MKKLEQRTPPGVVSSGVSEEGRGNDSAPCSSFDTFLIQCLCQNRNALFIRRLANLGEAIGVKKEKNVEPGIDELQLTRGFSGFTVVRQFCSSCC